MHPTQKAVEIYHQLLVQEDIRAQWEAFLAQMQAGLVTFGDRPVCNVLRPHFLHPQEFAIIAQATCQIVGAIHKLYHVMRAGHPRLRAALHLSEAEQALTALPDYFGPPDASARMDAFWLPGAALGEGRLYFLEYNAESPGGLIFGDVLTEMFLQQKPMQAFARRYHLRTLPIRRRILDTLLNCYRDWLAGCGRGMAALPNIAIVDWREVRTRNEFVLAGRFFEQHGCQVRICDPEELDFQNGRLWAAPDFPVDLVYKRVVVNEFIARYAPAGQLMSHPLVRAVRNRAVCLVNGFNVQLLYNKAFFALLSDEANASLLDAADRAAIHRHIPWTRLVEPRRTQFEKQEVDLLEFVARHKDDLVLKPIKEYGGKGVVLGWRVSQAEWQQALDMALVHPHIVQKRVPIPRLAFPVWDGGLQWAERTVDVDPYVWHGAQVAHAGVRLGTGDLLNVSAGGSATPLFLVQEKSG